MQLNKHTLIMLTPSYLLSLLFILLYSGAMICLTITSLPLWIKLIIFIASSIYFIANLIKNVLLLSATAIIKIKLIKENTWLLYQKNGTILEGTLQGSSFVSMPLLILNFKVAAKLLSRSVILIDPRKTQQLRKNLLSYKQ